MNRRLKNYLKNMGLEPFSIKALLTVSEIPEGKVRSYKWVAGKSGMPKAARAIGKILDRNPLPFLIPCHRVIKDDFTLGGYMCGAEFKGRLLSSEGLTVKDGIVIINRTQRG